ncbi:hypothetical protein CBL_08122 [Carabus blaptoides fortunei]
MLKHEHSLPPWRQLEAVTCNGNVFGRDTTPLPVNQVLSSQSSIRHNRVSMLSLDSRPLSSDLVSVLFTLVGRYTDSAVVLFHHNHHSVPWLSLANIQQSVGTTKVNYSYC